MTTNVINPVLAGVLAAIGVSASLPLTADQPGGIGCRPVYLSVSGQFVGTAQLVRSFDGGQTWVPVTNVPAITGPASIPFTPGTPAGVLYALDCTALTSGQIAFRFDQGAMVDPRVTPV